MSVKEELAIVKTLSLLKVPFIQYYSDCSQDTHMVEVSPPYEEFDY